METSHAVRLNTCDPHTILSVCIREIQGPLERTAAYARQCLTGRPRTSGTGSRRFAQLQRSSENQSKGSTERTNMAKFQPDGWHTVTPRIIAPEPERLVAFIKDVFRASGEFHPGRPAEIRIGDSMVMVSDGGGLRDPVQAFLYVYVEDTDSTYERAIAANAISMEAPSDMPYGDRRAMVKDRWGNIWQIATHKRDPASGRTEST